jgi:Family of unknown function (DUF6527)
VTNPVMVVRDVHRKAPGVDVITDDSPTVPNGRALWMWCPGCDSAHRVAVVGKDGTLPRDEPTWDWDGNVDAPTISPSILCHGTQVCHSFIRAGRWEFLADCGHALAGQTVDMVPLPDWLVTR